MPKVVTVGYLANYNQGLSDTARGSIKDKLNEKMGTWLKEFTEEAYKQIINQDDTDSEELEKQKESQFFGNW